MDCEYSEVKTTPAEQSSSGGRSRDTVAACKCASSFASCVVTCVGIAFGIIYRRSTASSVLFFNAEDIVNLNLHVSDFSTSLCSQYEVKTMFAKANIYLLPSAAEVDQNKWLNSSTTYKVLDDYDDIEDREHRLLQGSKIDVSACFAAGVPSEFVVIKGDDNFDKWESDRQCASCIWKKVDMDSSTNCSGNISTNLSLDVVSADNYRLILARKKKTERPHPYAHFIAHVNLARTRYDVSDYLQVCNMTDNCLLDLPYNTGSEIVVEFGRRNVKYSTRVGFKTRCELRTMFWVGMLCFIPLGLIIIVFILACCCC